MKQNFQRVLFTFIAFLGIHSGALAQEASVIIAGGNIFTNQSGNASISSIVFFSKDPGTTPTITVNLIGYDQHGNQTVLVSNVAVSNTQGFGTNNAYSISQTSYISNTTLAGYVSLGYSWSSTDGTNGSGPGNNILDLYTLPATLTANATQNKSFNYTVTATSPNGPVSGPVSYSATGLPPGLFINSSYGVISGTPTSGGTYKVAVYATNSVGTAHCTLTLNVAYAIPVFGPPTTASGKAGSAFSFTITATNAPTYTTSSLPSGLTLANGIISGIPTSAGIYSVLVTATNSAGSVSETVVITIAPAAPSVTTSCVGGSQAFITINNYQQGASYTILPYTAGDNSFLIGGTYTPQPVNGGYVLSVPVSSTATTASQDEYNITSAITINGVTLTSAATLFTVSAIVAPVVTVSANGGSGNMYVNWPQPFYNGIYGYYCIPLSGTTPTVLTLSVAPQPNTTYQWSFGTADGTVSNGWNTTPAQTGSAPYTFTGNILSITNFNNQPGYIILTVTDNCGHVIAYKYTINRFLPVPSTYPTALPANIYALLTLNTTCVTPGSIVTATVANTGLLQANLNPTTWSGPAGWTFTTNANGVTSIAIPSTQAAGTYTIYATRIGAGGGNSGCDNFGAELAYTINVKPAAGVTISNYFGNNGCFSPESSASQGLFSATDGGTYTWTVTNGGIYPPGSTPAGTGGQTNTYVGSSISYLSYGVTGTITATYGQTGCTVTLPVVNTRIGPIAPTFSSTNAICVPNATGATAKIKITNYPGTGSYSIQYYNVSPNFINFMQEGTGFTPDATGTITVPINPAVVTPTTGGRGVYLIQYNKTPCTTGLTGSYSTFIVDMAPQTFSLNGSLKCVNNNQPVLYPSPVLLAGTYSWTATAGTFSAATGNSVTYTPNGAATIKTTYTTLAGCATTISTPVTPAPPTPGITVTPTTITNAPTSTVKITITNYNSSYGNYILSYYNVSPSFIDFLKDGIYTPNASGVFTVPLNSTVTSATAGSGVYILTNAGCGNSYNWLPTINITKVAGRPAITTDASVTYTTVYPNPSNGNFSINIPVVNDKAFAVLYDANGRTIREIQLNQGVNSINATDVVSGIYYLTIDIDGQTSSNKIVIQK